MSLAGIAITIGVLCDEAVVMVENVHKRLEHAPAGLSRRQRQEIIIGACKQLGKPMFFALLVITVSFMPVFTLEAQEGRLFKPLAFTKTFTMAAAAFLSLTLGPALIVLMTGAKVIPGTPTPRQPRPPSSLLSVGERTDAPTRALDLAGARRRDFRGAGLSPPGFRVHATAQ
jgi:copper/silver efflux system protein